MRLDDAVALIAPAVGDVAAARGAWVDLGAGEGTFARALARLLGAGSIVHALDRDAGALAALDRSGGRDPRAAEIHTTVVDLADARALDALALPPLAGVVAANALHFVARDAQPTVLADWAVRLRPGGRAVVVEYDRRGASPWVPFPLDAPALRALSVPGLSRFDVVARRPSRHGGDLYVAVAMRGVGVSGR